MANKLNNVIQLVAGTSLGLTSQPFSLPAGTWSVGQTAFSTYTQQDKLLSPAPTVSLISALDANGVVIANKYVIHIVMAATDTRSLALTTYRLAFTLQDTSVSPAIVLPVQGMRLNVVGL